MCGACKIYYSVHQGFLLIFLKETIKNRKYKSDCSVNKGAIGKWNKFSLLNPTEGVAALKL